MAAPARNLVRTPMNPRHRLSHAAPSPTPLPRAAPSPTPLPRAAPSPTPLPRAAPSLAGPGAGPPAPPGEEAPRAVAQPRRGRGPLPRPDRFFEAMGHAAAPTARGGRRRQGGRARAGDLPVGGGPLRAARDRPAHGRYGEGWWCSRPTSCLPSAPLLISLPLPALALSLCVCSAVRGVLPGGAAGPRGAPRAGTSPTGPSRGPI